ncbi:hypothetical protein [Gymnodinialimonas ceratoperidinii]|nr:hypothetical protein [Gymnodinialimonas ceratoperidinii]
MAVTAVAELALLGPHERRERKGLAAMQNIAQQNFVAISSNING